MPGSTSLTTLWLSSDAGATWTEVTSVSNVYNVAMSSDAVYPNPATHSILRVLKAGETVYQMGEQPKTL